LTFRSFTGLDVSEFDSVFENIRLKIDLFEEKRLSRDDRERDVGAGHPFKLSVKDRLLMLLMYYRLYISSNLVGFLFNLDHSNVIRDIHYLEPALKECGIPIPQKIYERATRASTPEEVEEYFPGFKAFIDATEQEIPRPVNKKKRKTHYSGKSKRHTVKTQLTVNSGGLIVHKANHARGSRHDYALFKQRHPHLPKGVRAGVDLGYDGIQNDFPEMGPMLPFKRRSPGRGHKGEKAKKLTPNQKQFNKALSKARVVVEHTLSRVKKFNIFGQEFRNRLRHYDIMTDIISGLVNLRISGMATI
jgi:DDE superfamily endonuclease/Helix-turn-helix of DDE superfamily endonuclease